MVCLILNNEITNNIKAAVIIEGPEGVFNFKDENKPKNTEHIITKFFNFVSFFL